MPTKKMLPDKSIEHAICNQDDYPGTTHSPIDLSPSNPRLCQHSQAMDKDELQSTMYETVKADYSVWNEADQNQIAHLSIEALETIFNSKGCEQVEQQFPLSYGMAVLVIYP